MRAAITAMLVAAGAVQAQEPSMGPGDRPIDPIWSGRSAVYAQNGMAATAHPLATQTAIDVLKRGGSAVDAAIAANAVLGLMEPTGCGIGGDLFAIVWDVDQAKLVGLNGSGRSPQSRSLEQMREKLGNRTSIPPFGALPVTVPGTVDAWFELHTRYGKLRMRDVLAPAARYAENGFPLTPVIADLWGRNLARLEEAAAAGDLEEFDNARATYFTDNAAPEAGDIFRNPDLANTYRTIGEGGRDAFYQGVIARTIAEYMARIGGDLTYEDFAAHDSEWVEPLSTDYRGYTVWELPPNGQGASVLQILRILEGYNLAEMGAGSADALHVMIEAKRLVYEDLARYYADPAFAPFPADRLLSDSYAQTRRAEIAMETANAEIGPGEIALQEGDTTYLTVADSTGMMVSLIQSNYRGMGSGLVPDRLGFMLQDRGELFSLEEEHPNVYAPGKRPFHTIIPAFVTRDGAPWMSFGLMGGDMQPQGHVQILVNMIDFGMDVQAAGDAARFRHVGSASPTGDPRQGVGVVRLESGVPQAIVEALETRGHVIERARAGFGGYQAIRKLENGVYAGASERRKDGQAAGY